MQGSATGPVFLSHASQDAGTAVAIAAALRAAGIHVWQDQSELAGGDAWDAEIRRRIRECALFVALVSANTQQRLEGYFRLEWRLAEQRSHQMARGMPFIVPVALGAIGQQGARVPECFMEVQWMRLPDSGDAGELVNRIRELLQPATGPLPMPAEPAAGPAGAARSIAVLAFASMSHDPENEYFSDGISEELLNVLAQVPGLRVTARTSSFHFKGRNTPVPEIARQLGVTHVVEGSVRKAGNRVRITAQLISADGFHVWSGAFDRELQDIFSVQDEIARLVAQNLQQRLQAGSARRLVDPEVYRLCLLGRQRALEISTAGLDGAEGLFQQALRIDAGCAAALSGLAYVWHLRARMMQVRSQWIAREISAGEHFARLALQADPSQGEAQLMLGSFALLRRDMSAAGPALRRGLELNPNSEAGLDVMGFFHLDEGRPDLALETAHRAHALSPLAWAPLDQAGLALLSLGRLDEAIDAFRRASRLSAPPMVFANLANALARAGRRDEAVELARHALTCDSRGNWWQGFVSLSDGFAALALAEAGAAGEARQVVQRILSGPPERRFVAGLAMVRLGEVDEGIGLLQDTSEFVIFALLPLPHGGSIGEEDPRWVALMRRLAAEDAMANRRRVLEEAGRLGLPAG